MSDLELSEDFRNSLCMNNTDSDDSLGIFLIVLDKKPIDNSIDEQQERAEQIIDELASGSDTKFNYPHVLPDVWVEDDIVYARILFNEIQSFSSMYFYYCKFDSDDGMMSRFAFAMNINDANNISRSFDNASENYVILNLQAFENLRCRWAFPRMVIYPYADYHDEANNQFATPITQHNHNFSDLVVNVNNDLPRIINIAVAPGIRIKTEFANQLISDQSGLTALTERTVIGINGTVSNQQAQSTSITDTIHSNSWITDESDNHWLCQKGVAELFSDDSIHTNFALVKVV